MQVVPYVNFHIIHINIFCWYCLLRVFHEVCKWKRNMKVVSVRQPIFSKNTEWIFKVLYRRYTPEVVRQIKFTFMKAEDSIQCS